MAVAVLLDVPPTTGSVATVAEAYCMRATASVPLTLAQATTTLTLPLQNLVLPYPSVK